MEKVYTIYTLAAFYNLSDICVSIVYGLFRSPAICEHPSQIYKIMSGIPKDKRNISCNIFTMLYCFVSYYWKYSTNKAIKEFINNTPNLNFDVLQSTLDLFIHAGMSSVDAVECIKLMVVRFKQIECESSLKKIVQDMQQHNKGYLTPRQSEELKEMKCLEEAYRTSDGLASFTEVDKIGVKQFSPSGLSTQHTIKNHKHVIFELSKDKEERVKLTVEWKLEISKIYVYVSNGTKSIYKEFYKFDQEPGTYELCSYADLKDLGEKIEIRVAVGRVLLSEIKHIKPYQYIVKYISSLRMSGNGVNVKALYCYGDNGPVLSNEDAQVLDLIVAKCNKPS